MSLVSTGPRNDQAWVSAKATHSELGRNHMARHVIQTEKAPKAIGTYSQAIKIGNTVYLSGQIPLVPATMKLVNGDIRLQIGQVFDNLSAVAHAAGGTAIRLSFVIAVRDRNHLARVMHKVRGVKHVSGINRAQK